VLHARHARADFILVSHAHFDHVLDVPGIALATGALVIGSPSVVGYARSREVPAERTRVVESGERLELGSFVVDVRAVHHTAIAGVEEPLSGTIPSDAGGLWFWEFGCDVALAFRLEAAGASLWFHPSSSIYRTGTARGRAAGTLVIGVSGEPLTRRSIEAAFAEVRPERVLPTHYDNFLQPMARGHALMPGLDLDAAREAVLAVDPTVAWYVLDYEQEIRLPRDRAN
jgi:L-ascorbate metabolism protein UlaG (beta-lactamase superfamily)